MSIGKDTLRIVTTNDFSGSYFPRPASFGRLPGAQGLIETVGRLRADAPAALWIDVGDFADGPLAALDGGALGFVAASQLGFDAAVTGNHEFDWGEEALKRYAGELRCPLLCANYDVGLPGSTVLAAGDWRVAVIGLTHARIRTYNDTLLKAQPDPVETVREHVQALREAKVDAVVLALHDGIDWTPGQDGELHLHVERIAGFCAAVAAEVDMVLGGHSLARYAGELGGVPFVQPWAWGAEVGVVELTREGASRVYSEAVVEAGPWKGPGAGVYNALGEQIVGRLREPLINAPARSLSLAEAMARGVSALTSTDIALLFQELNGFQPPLDGAFGYLAAGPVSEADILCATAWNNGARVSTGEVTQAEAERLLERAEQRGGAGADLTSSNVVGPPALFRRAASGSLRTVAVNTYAVPTINGWIGRDIAWEEASITTRDGLRRAIADM